MSHIFHINKKIPLTFRTDSTKDSELSELQQQLNADTENEHQSSYLQLLQQREEENRQEVAKLTSEIRTLKLQLIQLKSNFFALPCLPSP